MGDSSNAKTIRNTITSWRKNLDNLLGAYARSPLAPVFVGKEINPLFRQTVEIVDQLPELLQTIANGQREFYPSPTDTKEACRRMYRARRTLLIKFENDDLDESEDIEKVLREANTIMRMKRPMVEMEVNLKTLSGTHITPLTQNPYLDVSLFSPLELPEQLRKLQVPAPILSNFIKTVDEVKEVIADFLEDTVKTKSI